MASWRPGGRDAIDETGFEAKYDMRRRKAADGRRKAACRRVTQVAAGPWPHLARTR